MAVTARMLIHSFGGDRRGNVAMIAALSIIPILSIAGFAIDVQMVTTQKNKIQNVIDSAVMAGSKAMQLGKTRAEISKEVNDYVSGLLANEGSGTVCGNVMLTYSDIGQDINAGVSCYQKTTISAIMGKDKLKFYVNSGTTYGVGKVDVAFVFDVSGSMDPDNKLVDLKTAAKDAVDLLMPNDENLQEDFRVSMVSYATGVNAGSFYKDVTGRSGPHNVTATIQKIKCVERISDGSCSSWYILQSEDVQSTRADMCTFDREGSQAYDDTRATSSRPLMVSPTSRVLLDQNLLTNGSLETSSFSGGQATRSYVQGWVSMGGQFDMWKSGNKNVYAQDGYYFLELDEDRGAVFQDVSTKKGKYYDIRFRMRSRPDYSVGDVEVYWDGDLIDTINPANNWKTYLYNVEASQKSLLTNKSRLMFKSIDGGFYGALLDDVYVTEMFDTCPDQEPLPLTADRGDVNDFIDSLKARGGTSGHHGLAWGWYLISPEWKSYFPTDSEPYAYDEPDSSKVIILMTDGAFNLTRSTQNGTSDAQARKTCDEIKKKGVMIFTVAFDAPDEAKELLSYCASGANRAFTAEDGQSLKDSYKTIAQSISDLRITH